MASERPDAAAGARAPPVHRRWCTWCMHCFGLVPRARLSEASRASSVPARLSASGRWCLCQLHFIMFILSLPLFLIMLIGGRCPHWGKHCTHQHAPPTSHSNSAESNRQLFARHSLIIMTLLYCSTRTVLCRIRKKISVSSMIRHHVDAIRSRLTSLYVSVAFPACYNFKSRYYSLLLVPYVVVRATRSAAF